MSSKVNIFSIWFLISVFHFDIRTYPNNDSFDLFLSLWHDSVSSFVESWFAARYSCCHLDRSRPKTRKTRTDGWCNNLQTFPNQSPCSPKAQSPKIRTDHSLALTRLIIFRPILFASKLVQTSTLASFTDICKAGPGLCMAESGQQLSVR